MGKVRVIHVNLIKRKKKKEVEGGVPVSQRNKRLAHLSDARLNKLIDTQALGHNLAYT